MGVHHYKIEAIPHILGQDCKESLSDWINENSTWSKSIPSKNFLDSLRKLLPTEESWGSTEEYVSNNKWGSDLRILKNEDDENIIEDINFRFSTIVDEYKYLKRFLEICLEENCLVFSEETGEVLKPIFEIVEKDLKTTRAFKFISNPENTIVEAAEFYNKKKKGLTKA